MAGTRILGNVVEQKRAETRGHTTEETQHSWKNLEKITTKNCQCGRAGWVLHEGQSTIVYKKKHIYVCMILDYTVRTIQQCVFCIRTRYSYCCQDLGKKFVESDCVLFYLFLVYKNNNSSITRYGRGTLSFRYENLFGQIQLEPNAPPPLTVVARHMPLVCMRNAASGRCCRA